MNEGRLSFGQAAWVVARRDFVAVLWSRAFLFFLLGPLFPLVVGIMAGGVTRQVTDSAEQARIGVAMEGHEADAVIAAHRRLAGALGRRLPAMEILQRLEPGQTYDARGALAAGHQRIGAVLTGTRASPVLAGTADRIDGWRGPVELTLRESLQEGASAYPRVTLAPMQSSAAKRHAGRIATAQLAQTVLFLLIMLLAGMVLSNLVEEKTNKIIEVLAAAIPMNAVFCGKLFAMLGVSIVGIAVWALAGGAFLSLTGPALPDLPQPALGWPAFLLLGLVYFAMGYLLLGSLFLTIGGMASTVREVQTLSMPVTMMQLLVFFFATYAMAQPGSTVERLAIAFPLSSPFAMLARAAQDEAWWPHVVAIGWQALAVTLLIRGGAALFRKRVMKSGPRPRGSWRMLRRRGRDAG